MAREKWCDALYQNSLSAQQMKAQGYSGLLAYWGAHNLSKDLTPSKFAELRAAGLFVIAVYEVNTTDGTNASPAVEYGEGRDHANEQMADILAKGGDNTIALLPAVDEHLTASMITQAVEYQRGFRDAVKAAGWAGPVGCYGFSEFLIAVAAAGVADFFWGCGSAAALPGWAHIWQDNTITDTIGGVAVDVDWIINPLPQPTPPPQPKPKTVEEAVSETLKVTDNKQVCHYETGTASAVYAAEWYVISVAWGALKSVRVWCGNADGSFAGVDKTFDLASNCSVSIPMPANAGGNANIEWDATKSDPTALVNIRRVSQPK